MSNSRQNICEEILLRAILFIVYILLHTAIPFERKILQEEMWLYRYPVTNSYVPNHVLWPILFGVPLAAILINYNIENDPVDMQEAILSLTLSMGLTGTITHLLKIITGRPRPDFFWRCFPEGNINQTMECSGNKLLVIEGRKSFPSGHSSMSFASLGFLSLYLMAKLHVFNNNGRGQGWRVLICFLPVILASCISVSRSCDYHHHDQDILAGTLLGLMISYFCYHQYYPSLNCQECHRSFVASKHQ